MQQEAKRPGNLPATPMPTEGFVLSVDGKLKTRYDTSEAALAAAVKLKQTYPVIRAGVYDTTARTYAMLGDDGKVEKPADEKKEKEKAAD